MTNQLIGPSEAGKLVAKIQNARDRLNAAIRSAAVKGVNVTVEAEGESFDHYWFKIVRIDDPRIDLEWEPPGTYAEEEAA